MGGEGGAKTRLAGLRSPRPLPLRHVPFHSPSSLHTLLTFQTCPAGAALSLPAKPPLPVSSREPYRAGHAKPSVWVPSA